MQVEHRKAHRMGEWENKNSKMKEYNKAVNNTVRDKNIASLQKNQQKMYHDLKVWIFRKRPERKGVGKTQTKLLCISHLCCITNYPKLSGLQQQTSIISHSFMGQESGSSLAGHSCFRGCSLDVGWGYRHLKTSLGLEDLLPSRSFILMPGKLELGVSRKPQILPR